MRKCVLQLHNQQQLLPNNVNDLITVTKQTIKVGDGKDNVAAAHDGKDIEYDTEFTIDNKVKKAIQ